MKQSGFLRTCELFNGSDVVRRFTFKTVNTRDSYARFSGINCHISMGFGVSRDNCAYLYDCFECISLEKVAA